MKSGLRIGESTVAFVAQHVEQIIPDGAQRRFFGILNLSRLQFFKPVQRVIQVIATGLKEIAVFEMVEKHAARAKDATKLEQAIRAKLQAQADFVQWWDTQGPGTNHGGSRKNGKIADRKSWPVDPVTVHRWRKKLTARSWVQLSTGQHDGCSLDRIRIGPRSCARCAHAVDSWDSRLAAL